MTLPAAGWYADPVDPTKLRWWDGAQWTQATTPVPAAAPAQPVQQPVQPVAEPAVARPAEPAVQPVVEAAPAATSDGAAETSADAPAAEQVDPPADVEQPPPLPTQALPEQTPAEPVAEQPSQQTPSAWPAQPEQPRQPFTPVTESSPWQSPATTGAPAAAAEAAPAWGAADQSATSGAPSPWTSPGQGGGPWGTAPQADPQPQAAQQPPVYGQPEPQPGYGQPAGYQQPDYSQYPAAPAAGGYQPYPQPGYGQPYPAAYPGGKATTTPDGQPLAGLGARLGARIIDWFVTLVIGGLAGINLWITGFRRLFSYMNDNGYFEPNAVLPANPFQIYTDSGALGPLIGAGIVYFIVGAVYSIGMTGWKGGTLGKLMLGLRVRSWAEPRQATYGQAAKRWATRELLSIFSVLGTLYILLDTLWPLWDDKKQALHDKWPKTVVVKKQAAAQPYAQQQYPPQGYPQ